MNNEKVTYPLSKKDETGNWELSDKGLIASSRGLSWLYVQWMCCQHSLCNFLEVKNEGNVYFREGHDVGLSWVTLSQK